MIDIKTARNAAGLTQQQLAALLNRPQSYIGKLENGTYKIENISLKNAVALASALGVKAEDLI